jgi:4-oxalocrotonate tautomerase
MPFINIKTNIKKDEKVKEKIVKKVLANTSDILHKDPKVTSILVEFVPFDVWSIDTQNQNTFYLDIKITKGTNTKEEKAKYIKETYEGLKDILGDITTASYVLIDEVDASLWGFDGITQEYRYIQSKIK